MRMQAKRIAVTVLTFLVLFGGMPAVSADEGVEGVESYASALPKDEPASWIIRWEAGVDSRFLEESMILDQIEDMNIVVASPKSDRDPEGWIARWAGASGVRYFEANGKVKTLATKPNDPLFATQAYLKQTGMDVAWDLAKGNTSKIIAVVDTGVDLNHPDLKANLVAGVNLLDESAKPQDDNGHGTNVGGVVGAVGNNKIGVTGGLWQAKIMPVKALEADGSGDEAKLGEGIKYAVDNGASIIVLSSGLFKYSRFMQDVVDYAESKGVLLVAASGNEGQAVKYPAAYPSVLAVGGVDGSNNVDPRSNFGPEVDLVAPMDVHTTALGGQYTDNEGTSMAAPQVAAAAALIWSKHPSMKPSDIRKLLSQTAKDIGAPGWDQRSGYGLLRADLALKAEPKTDIFEPNNTSSEAKPLPIDTIVSASMDKSSDVDWYYLNAPYSGTIELKLYVAETHRKQFAIESYHEGATESFVNNPDSAIMRIPVKKGISMLKVSYTGELAQPVEYRLGPNYQIYRDPFEDNDRQYKAYALPAKKQSIKGTFHLINDQDWFVIQAKHSGSLQLTASADTYRMDLEIMVQKQGEEATVIDDRFDGLPEYSEVIDVEPGMYYIRVRNVNYGKDSHPVRGEYTLDVNFTERYEDPNEPNNRSYQATVLKTGTSYEGVFDKADDLDWFSFTVNGESYATIKLDRIPKDRVVSVTLYNQQQKQLAAEFNELPATSLTMAQPLARGTYYLRLKTNQSFNDQLYRLSVETESLTAGFRDVKGHWALDAIRRLSNDGILSGYADYRFLPNDTLTRAEAAVVLSKTMKLPAGSSDPGFKDLKSSHWAYASIAAVNEAGILNGYPDGTFKPNRPVTRGEMAVMLFNLLDMKVPANVKSTPFSDVSSTHWARVAIAQLAKEGWLTGFPDDTFRPDAATTRAQFAYLMNKWLEDHE